MFADVVNEALEELDSVERWLAHGIDPTERVVWKRHRPPHSLSLALRWQSGGFASASALQCLDAGFESPAEVSRFTMSGYGLPRAMAWRSAGARTPEIAAQWDALGYSPELAAPWFAAGLGSAVTAARAWSAAGFSPQAARSLIARGVTDPLEAAAQMGARQ